MLDTNLNRVSIVITSLALSASVWALDVKPGLWEITTKGMGEPQRVCYTEASFDLNMTNMKMPPGVECKNEIKESSGIRIVTHTVCTGTMSMNGDTTVTAQNPELMLMVSKATMVFGGHPQEIETAADYRWLQGDCGDIKPFDPNAIMQ